MKSADEIGNLLGARRRTLLIGGMAVIVHGLNRTTRDVDLWLDPGATPEKWAESLAGLLHENAGLRLTRIDSEGMIKPEELASIIDEDRVVRLCGTDRPLDLFRIPTNSRKATLKRLGSAVCRSSPARCG